MLENILYLIGGLVAGCLIGFFIARILTKKYLNANPPINEKMIEAMMSGMGRKPSQKQVRQVMRDMNRFK